MAVYTLFHAVKERPVEDEEVLNNPRSALKGYIVMAFTLLLVAGLMALISNPGLASKLSSGSF